MCRVFIFSFMLLVSQILIAQSNNVKIEPVNFSKVNVTDAFGNLKWI